MFQYLFDHKEAVGAVASGVGLLISEIMPFLPSKYNGVAHAIVGLLGGNKTVTPE